MVSDSDMLQFIKEFLQILRDSPEIKAITGYDRAQCVIVGGAAVRCYFRKRSVEDNFDIAIFPPEFAPKLKKVLSKLQYFEMRLDQLVWHTIYGCIRIGIRPTDDFTTIPKNLQLLGNLDPDHLPVIPLTELIIFKAQACGNRSEEQNKRDAEDVIKLMELFPGRSFRRRLMDRQWASLQLVKPSLKASKKYKWDTAF
ncbi:hypothetical protein BO79DRAFT_249889 [Aspergillus costaricaensis CBS 115574]|uniref:Uncharacterized protein n=1 Tax=Aspergillus costaricaensis CBS 115574 TaxID=1448317 RepID=A0ACD1IW21_9EURO|nr:hypothetical protein BO79DRAFT_249889 [Aspergillus costaricaensis CBS 115574]RAK94689.1 hypothetical protein BO79DRAFT_249889 [Aspergillus costaricaensis CBS 115574]